MEISRDLSKQEKKWMVILESDKMTMLENYDKTVKQCGVSKEDILSYL